jgi:two-component system, OmpR family, KDP operon response regulator KdpE
MNTKNILVLEDATLVRNLVHGRLEAAGYDVTSASMVSEALHEIRAKMPDLIILDLGLEDEDPFAALTDGFAFLGMLRRSYPGSDTSVIIYSVSCSPEIEARAKSLGVLEVIEKKRGMPALLGAVKQAFQTREEKAA